MMNFGVFVVCCLAGIQLVNSQLIPRLTNFDVVTSPAEYPYHISLQVDGSHTCGGSIIGKKHVLTAAHCTYDLIVDRVDKSRIKVVVGTATIAGGTKMDVDRIAAHEDYVRAATKPTLVSDISVIRLKTEITESEFVKVIGLPTEGEELPEGTRLIISGYGTHVLNGPSSPVLKHMYELVVSPEHCVQAWAGGLTMVPGIMCAGLAPGYGACQGDSGSPLVTENKQVLVGVASAVSRKGCGSGLPDLFTKVSYHIQFIRSEMAMPDEAVGQTGQWTGTNPGGWNNQITGGWNNQIPGGWNNQIPGGWNNQIPGGWNNQIPGYPWNSQPPIFSP